MYVAARKRGAIGVASKIFECASFDEFQQRHGAQWEPLGSYESLPRAREHNTRKLKNAKVDQ